MADALVSTILDQIATIVVQQVKKEVELVVGATKEIDKLGIKLQSIQLVLSDAERRQLKDNAVRNWVNKLKGVSYDIDDVLDEWSTAIIKWKMDEAENAQVPKKMVCSFLPSPCFCFNQLVRRRDIALKIKEVSERLDVIVKEKQNYGFDLNRAIEEPARLGSSTTSFVDVTRVRGRDDDKTNLLRRLLSESSTQEAGKIPVISVVGIGGIGKTTLAQLAYNDVDVKAHFDKRIWVCVSDPFEGTGIARAIVEQLTGETPNLADLESLCRKISESIEGTKFLLVLDDVWTEDSGKWEPLKLSLKDGASGSRILVTCRKDAVATMMETVHWCRLGKLSDEECWSLFSQVAFDGRTEDDCERLTDVGKKIADKCRGLPLAAKTLGGLMQSKKSKEEWRNVLSSELWELEEVERDLFPPFLLSYYDLPAAVRRCFAICAMFPKACTMEKGELIRLWMAQGYLKPSRSKDMESVGNDYFEILEARAFFQVIFEGLEDRMRFKMHDIVHDFAQYLMKNECLVLGDVIGSEKPRIDLYESIRHSSVCLLEEASFPVSIYNVKKLRSLKVISKGNVSIEAALSTDIFNHLICLRSLDLSYSAIEEIPSDVEKLIHLRHLSLRGCTKLKALVETASNLINLQALDLQSCRSLNSLPQGLGKLSNLRHLNTYFSSLAFLPKGIGGLTSLRTLCQFNVCGNERNAASLGELKNLNNLQGYLRICNASNVADAREADLKNKTRLVGLSLYFSEEGERESCLDEEGAVIEALQPPSDLELLEISGYGGISLPTWMMSLTNLRTLRCFVCEMVENLPPLGRLPYLETLEINQLGARKLDVGFLGIDESRNASVTAFPKLKELNIWGWEELEDWDDVEKRLGEQDPTTATIMPQVQRLGVTNCHKLTVLPDYILTATLQDLDISGCPILEDRYRETGEDWQKISHIPNIRITGPHCELTKLLASITKTHYQSVQVEYHLNYPPLHP